MHFCAPSSSVGLQIQILEIIVFVQGTSQLFRDTFSDILSNSHYQLLSLIQILSVWGFKTNVKIYQFQIDCDHKSKLLVGNQVSLVYFHPYCPRSSFQLIRTFVGVKRLIKRHSITFTILSRFLCLYGLKTQYLKAKLFFFPINLEMSLHKKPLKLQEFVITHNILNTITQICFILKTYVRTHCSGSIIKV